MEKNRVMTAMNRAVGVLVEAGIECGLGEMHNSGKNTFVFLALYNVEMVGAMDYRMIDPVKEGGDGTEGGMR